MIRNLKRKAIDCYDFVMECHGRFHLIDFVLAWLYLTDPLVRLDPADYRD